MRKALSIVVALIGLILVLALTGVFLAQRALTAAGIGQLEWQGLRLGWSGVQVEQITGNYHAQQGTLAFQISALQLQLGGDSRFRLAAINLQTLQLDWRPQQASADDTTDGLPDPLAWQDQLALLPDQLQVESLELRVPCPTGSCTAQGEFRLNRLGEERFAAQLVLNAPEGRLKFDAQLHSDVEALDLQAQLQLSGQPAATLEGRWSQRDQLPVWAGSVQVTQWPQADWLLAYAAPWLGRQAYPFEQLPTGMRASVDWNLAPVTRPAEWVDLLDGQVQLNADIALPQSWYWPEVGELQGQMLLDVVGDNGDWGLQQGSARLVIDQPAVAALQRLPEDLRPNQLILRIDPEDNSALGRATPLSLGIELEATGRVELGLAGQLTLTSRPHWQAEWQLLTLKGAAAELDLDELQLRGLKLDWPFEGRLDAQQLTAQFGEGARLQASSIVDASTGMALQNVSLDLSGLQLQSPLDEALQISLKGPLNMTAASVNHDVLEPQGWALDGELDYSAQQIGWKGVGKTTTGLGLDVEFDWPEQQPWRANVSLQEVFLRAANPLADTFSGWPSLLSFASGRLTGQLEAVGSAGLDSVQGQFTLSGGKGIFDRSTFEGLTANINLALAADDLQLVFPDLRLEALDPGMPLGPVSFSGEYRAELANLTGGVLNVDAARMGMLGGQVRVNAARLDLSRPRQSVLVELEGVELGRLFEVYPAEGLSGRGTLDGRLPVSLEGGKLVVDDGQLQAREPGGFLRYRSEKLDDLARSNAGMRQVAAALDDFQYSVLASDVAYDQDGLLVLGLQLQGHNPSLQDGRPIHLNIRLEENVPALLASLQLSGQVSDIIQKRVQERLLQRRLAPDP
ncbi:hypothetical protein DT594_13385 [Halopseudomonas laoshanensis]|uniref:Dicarboxylate transport domain-containing protein n=1 Tax=Halopseudomonas laoshanensis TaxID=2268758 RepID=A0A7V7GTA0_9GAMM|nr:YdbH domain-containing protein [Halopseudomonas laoshanensis]KAA0694283.1 hypothetical protein DT594_13385 [Halopseudomonas laoshanensis]